MSIESCDKCKQLETEFAFLRNFLADWFSVLLTNIKRYDERMDEIVKLVNTKQNMAGDNGIRAIEIAGAADNDSGNLDDDTDKNSEKFESSDHLSSGSPRKSCSPETIPSANSSDINNNFDEISNFNERKSRYISNNTESQNISKPSAKMPSNADGRASSVVPNNTNDISLTNKVDLQSSSVASFNKRRRLALGSSGSFFDKFTTLNAQSQGSVKQKDVAAKTEANDNDTFETESLQMVNQSQTLDEDDAVAAETLLNQDACSDDMECSLNGGDFADTTKVNQAVTNVSMMNQGIFPNALPQAAMAAYFEQMTARCYGFNGKMNKQQNNLVRKELTHATPPLIQTPNSNVFAAPNMSFFENKVLENGHEIGGQIVNQNVVPSIPRKRASAKANGNTEILLPSQSARRYKYSDYLSEDHRCLVCNAQLKNHMSAIHHVRRSHIPGGKRYTCEYCRRSFYQKFHRDKHVENVHLAAPPGASSLAV